MAVSKRMGGKTVLKIRDDRARGNREKKKPIAF
jgi:hypothetical protein